MKHPTVRFAYMQINVSRFCLINATIVISVLNSVKFKGFAVEWGELTICVYNVCKGTTQLQARVCLGPFWVQRLHLKIFFKMSFALKWTSQYGRKDRSWFSFHHHFNTDHMFLSKGQFSKKCQITWKWFSPRSMHCCNVQRNSVIEYN